MDETAAIDLATARYRETEQAHEAARQDAIAAVTDALRAGIRQSDVVAHSPFTASFVRRLARENGIKAAHKRASRPVPDTES
ncbi:hypothetical protein [Yinghuangia soli]|uniref:Uncharacterized protein n=1 Tax=Yinghuangia soli TaxID=2908204 RepID=A0AA41TY02_9ACTN|nr:hypothetical protein [Yinghuangia soli]MCF2527353.1 hypothetical protein [Yinghuangia soli]